MKMDFIKNLLPIPSIKIPKLKKIRQWSHDRISDLGQATGISSTIADYKEKRRSLDETATAPRHYSTNGISTISSAIREHQMNPPRRDNYGLYALKQDRSLSFESAKRGILLSIPSAAHATSRIHTRADVHQSFERNHEIFKSCEKVVGSSIETAQSSTSFPPSNNSDVSSKIIEPPPRKKKRQTATMQILKHSKPPKVPILKRAESHFAKDEMNGANDSDLFRIVNTNTEKAKVMIEEPHRRGSVTMVKPRVGRAERVRFQTEKPVIAKVKSYEWQKHQRKASVGSIRPPVPIIKLNNNKKYQYQPSDSSSSLHSDKSVDIFQSNRLKDQQKLFDEFDELFKKSKDGSENEPPTAETALRKLRELKKASTTSSVEGKASPDDDVRTSAGTNVKTFRGNTPPEVRQQVSKALERVDEVSTKPKIVYEQPKALSGVMKKKIIYYDDESEMRQLIMNQTQTTTIINNHYETNFTSKSASNQDDISTIFKNLQNVQNVQGKMPISSLVSATGPHQRQFESHYDDVDASNDIHRHMMKQQQLDVNANTGYADGNSNSLRIFSNEGIFVFNL